jgi:hypothetical protein
MEPKDALEEAIDMGTDLSRRFWMAGLILGGRDALGIHRVRARTKGGMA